MSSSLNIGFVMVGKELLQGFTTDTNSSFLAGRLTRLGHQVKRIIIVDDSHTDIIKALRSMMKGDLSIIFVCGGLGTTPDDITMEAVGKALGRPLIKNKKVLSWLAKKAKSAFLSGRIPSMELDQSWEKMAMVPKGSTVIYNEPGAAPGVLIPIRSKKKGEGRSTTIKVLILPGVPKELKYIYSHGIEGKMIGAIRNRPYFEEIEVKVAESTMQPILEWFNDKIEDVSIGSYPQDDHRVILRLFGPRERVRASIPKIKGKLKALEMQME